MKQAALYPIAISASMILGTSASGQANTEQANPSSTAAIIITGNRPSVNTIPQDSTFTESTITPEAILNITPSPATTVQTLLTTQPSIYATTGATNGMETNIKFRSFSDGEFGETVAGVPLNDIFNSGVTYQADNRNNALLITRDLDSVEVYRGVNNPAVNTYNSLGGTINFIPRQPTATMGGDIGVDAGSFGTLNYHMTLNTGDIHGVRQTVSFENDYSRGWLQNTSDKNANLYYAGNADLGSSAQLFGYFVYNRNKGNAPQFIPQNILQQQFDFQWPTNLYQSKNFDTNYLGIIGFKTAIGKSISLEDEAFGGQNNYTRTSFSNPDYTGPYFIDDQGSGFDFWSSYMGYNPPDTIHGTDYHFYGYDASVIGNRIRILAHLPSNEITVGGDISVGKLHSREYWYGAANMPMTIGYNDAWDERDHRTEWSVYAQDEIHFWDDRIHVTPGLKYIHAYTRDYDALGFYYSSPGSDSATEDMLSPTIGASAELIPHLTVYGSYGKNVKFPDITAFYNAIAGVNTAPIVVKPEYANDYELGVRYKFKGVTAAINAYQENFSDIIFSSATATGFTQYQNGGGQRYRGIEAQLTDEFGHFLLGRWNGYLNASYNKAICTSVTQSDLTGQRCNPGQDLPNVPQYLVSGGLIWDYEGWHVDVEGHYVGAQKLEDFFTSLPIQPGDLEPGQYTEIPHSFLVNVGVIKVIPLKSASHRAIRLAFHVDNLFDKRYFSAAQVNTRNLDMTGANQAEDFYGLAGEPRGVFGSIGLYF